MLSYGGNTYSAWAGALSGITGIGVSKQAIFGRMNKAWVDLTKRLLEDALKKRIASCTSPSVFTIFKRVLLQDSTCLHLPDCLYPVFNGTTVKGKKKAVVKFNLVMDVLTGHFESLNCLPYNTTEQALSKSIFGMARTGDLVIRDLGYSSMKVFLQMDESRIFFLSRLRYGLSLVEAETLKPFNLVKQLKGKTSLNCWIRCGQGNALKMRLVALKLNAAQAEERKRKAGKHRDKRLNHKEDYYTLLEYVIFITNVKEDVWSQEQIGSAYRVRWNIEIIFKSWKSSFNIKKMIPADIVNTNRVESILYMILLYLLQFQHKVYMPAKQYAKQMGYVISPLKLAKRILRESMDWLTVTSEPQLIKTKSILKCCYDKRRRINADQYLQQFITSLA